ncbi:protein gooseberry-neuro-like [Ptychodera flava]|uniref:protein gooseberry-neuro-like n=1 Tax=Ptychodera flava TaxID=63121 RepID=UPI003969D7AC
MEVSQTGRSFCRGKPLSNDLRYMIRTEMLSLGANNLTGYFPSGSMRKVAERFKVNKSTVSRIWKRFCETGEIVPGTPGGQTRNKLTDPDLEFIEVLKRERPSITYKEITEQLLQYGSVNSVSVSTVGRAVRTELTENSDNFSVASTFKDKGERKVFEEGEDSKEKEKAREDMRIIKIQEEETLVTQLLKTHASLAKELQEVKSKLEERPRR